MHFRKFGLAQRIKEPGRTALIITSIVALTGFPVDAAVALKGVVTDDQKKPVANAIVSLVKRALVDTTDATGVFILQAAENPVLHGNNSLAIRDRIQIRNNAIVFFPTGNNIASMELYTISGQQIASVRRLAQSSDLLAISTRSIAKGTYLLNVSNDKNTTTFKVITFQHNQNSSYEFGNLVLLNSTNYGVLPATDIVDTLLIRQGLTSTAIPLKSLTDTTITIKVNSQGAIRCIESVTEGGTWFDTKTWKGGIIPDKSHDVIINGMVYASNSATDTSSCRSLTVNPGAVLRSAAYTRSTLYVYGDLLNLGDVRNGPDYASYDDATLVVKLSGNLFQDSLYRPSTTYFTSSLTQTLGVGTGDYLSGTFYDITPVSSLSAATNLEFRSFSLKFDSTATPGVLDMNSKTFRLASGTFTLTNGILATNLIICDSLTDFTCARVKSVSGATVLRGNMRSNSITFDSSVIVDSNSIVFNLGYTDAIFTIKGDFTNKGLTRRGPGYAAFGEGNLAIILHKNFVQNGTYTVQHTKFIGTASHSITVGAVSVLQGTYYSDETTADLVAASAIKFRDFTLDFGSTSGRVIMGTFEPVISSGAFVIKGGSLETAVIKADSLTTFTCKNVKGTSGTVTLKGHICTDSTIYTADLIVDAGTIFYNKAYIDAFVTVKGSFTNNGLTRRGPGYAAFGEGNLVMIIEKNFRQNGVYTVQYTRFTGTTEQTIGTDTGKIIQGDYYDDTPLTPLKATTPLIINEAKFDLSPDTINKGLFAMDTFRLFHPAGHFKIDSGTIQVDSITGGVDGNTTFTLPYITTKNGSVTVNKHFRTASSKITGTLIVDSNSVFYNQGYLEAYVTTTTGTTIRGTIGSGPGYAAFGEGLLFLNGVQLAVWRAQ